MMKLRHEPLNAQGGGNWKAAQRFRLFC